MSGRGNRSPAPWPPSSIPAVEFVLPPHPARRHPKPPVPRPALAEQDPARRRLVPTLDRPPGRIRLDGGPDGVEFGLEDLGEQGEAAALRVLRPVEEEQDALALMRMGGRIVAPHRRLE